MPSWAILYPESDDRSMLDNFKEFRWLVTFYTNLAALFHDTKDVFVAGSMLWYPVEGDPDIRQTPDVMVVFGRPKAERECYRQWEENNVPVQVVFDIRSPGEDAQEIIERFVFYRDHGIEEYYLYNPQTGQLAIYRRKHEVLRRIRKLSEWVSPRLGIRFDRSGPELVVYRPDGQRFRTFEEVHAELEQQERMAQNAIKEAEREKQRAERLADRLRQLGVVPES